MRTNILEGSRSWVREQPVKSVSPQQAKAAAPPLSPLEKVKTWRLKNL